MSPSLRRLCCFSRSRIQGSDTARTAEVERLLSVSRIINARLGITGMLLSSEDCFAQILEGTPEAVGEVFSRIERDRRHALHEQAMATRAFANWSMAGVTNPAWRPPGSSDPGRLHEQLAGILPPSPMN